MRFLFLFLSFSSYKVLRKGWSYTKLCVYLPLSFPTIYLFSIFNLFYFVIYIFLLTSASCEDAQYFPGEEKKTCSILPLRFSADAGTYRV
jgi:hypothetical protein